MSTKNYGKTLYNQISNDIITYSESEIGMAKISSLKDIKCSDEWTNVPVNELDYLDKVGLCTFLETKYDIAVSDENLKKLDNLEKFAACICGLVLSKNLQRK